MPRKRLTDLLQEEVQKFTPDESVVETTAKRFQIWNSLEMDLTLSP